MALDDNIWELRTGLNSAWAFEDQPKFGLPAGYTVEQIQGLLKVDLASFVSVTETIIDKMISALEDTVRVLEDCNKNGLSIAFTTLLESIAIPKSFCETTASGAPHTTVKEAMQGIRREMVHLAQGVADHLKTVEILSRTTRDLGASMRAHNALHSSVSPGTSMAHIRADLGDVLAQECERTEKKLAAATISLVSLARSLRVLVEEKEPDSLHIIDAESVRPGVEKLKEVRQKAKEEASVAYLLREPRSWQDREDP
ncbi:hypothetical protein V5O48_009578 [Marasmius crinis-equi]|uniref:Uncharacterized protein n=1 Tax=Marasmius crinis-equi TaxID=585013 RepID=A0ABR3FB98_9AGAR